MSVYDLEQIRLPLQYGSIEPDARDRNESSLEKARDPKKVTAHACLLDRQEKIAQKLGLLPTKTDPTALAQNKQTLADFHSGRIDRTATIERLATDNRLPIEVALGMLAQFAEYGHLELHLTDVCNLNCQGCTYAVARVGAAPADVLPFDSIANLGNLPNAPKSIVVVGGGEPTLYGKGQSRQFHDAMNTLATFARRGTRIGLITNGVIFPELDGGWQEHVRWVRVSIDAAKPATYCTFRGRDKLPIVFNNFLKYLLRTRIKQVGVSFLYSNGNVDDYSDFVCKVYHLVVGSCPTELPRVNIQFRPLRCADPKDNQKFAVSKEQINRQLQKLTQACEGDQALRAFVRRQTNATALWGGNEHPLLRFSACRYSSVAGIVRASGKIIPCFCKVGAAGFVVGDLRALDLPALGLRKLLIRSIVSESECSPETCRMSFINKVVEDYHEDKVVPPGLGELISEQGI